MTAFVCPACGEQDQLRGRQEGDAIKIACERCGQEWTRDRDVCPACGKRSIADVREPLFQKARGTQQSIIAYRIVQECYSCGHRPG